MKPICTTIATVLALCLPAVAEAKPEGYPLPDPQTHEIQEPSEHRRREARSVPRPGEQALGRRAASAAARCCPTAASGATSTTTSEGRAEVQALDGTVDFVKISWNGVTENGKPDVRRAIARFKTSEGIGLGSKLADVGNAYPNAEAIKHPVATAGSRPTSSSRAASSMIFGGGKFVNYIVINDAELSAG